MLELSWKFLTNNVQSYTLFTDFYAIAFFSTASLSSSLQDIFCSYIIVANFFPSEDNTVKRTYQGSKKRRQSTCGFRARMKTVGGRKVIASRRRQGRRRLSA